MSITIATADLQFPEVAPLTRAAADYDIVRRAIAHIRGNWRAQPDIETVAAAAGVSGAELHHLFRRWCGLTPKAFLQAITLNNARELLRRSTPTSSRGRATTPAPQWAGSRRPWSWRSSARISPASSATICTTSGCEERGALARRGG